MNKKYFKNKTTHLFDIINIYRNLTLAVGRNLDLFLPFHRTVGKIAYESKEKKQ